MEKQKSQNLSKADIGACVRSGGKEMVLISPGHKNRNKVAVISGSCVHMPEEWAYMQHCHADT